MTKSSYVRSNIQEMQAYMPGEQPKKPGLIKLNTNENPYPPSSKVAAVLKSAIDDRLRLYPDPTSTVLREKLGGMYGFDPQQIIIGNGCDDLLNLCVRTFCKEGEKLAYFWPSYSLYPVLSNIQGSIQIEVPLDEYFQINAHPFALSQLEDAKLIFITQPNAPSGVWLQKVEIQRVIEASNGVVVIDEAYVDFASDHCLDFVTNYSNVIVARSFSKSYSLAGMRIGWAVGAIELISALGKIKDSYNVNRLSQLAAEVALDDRSYFDETRQKIRATRDRVILTLKGLGFFVYPSQTNFVFVKPPAVLSAQEWFEKLRNHDILIRWWDTKDRIRDFARVSIGSDKEIDQLIARTREICETANL